MTTFGALANIAAGFILGFAVAWDLRRIWWEHRAEKNSRTKALILELEAQLTATEKQIAFGRVVALGWTAFDTDNTSWAWFRALQDVMSERTTKKP